MVASGKAALIGHLDPNQMIGLTITLGPRRQKELNAFVRDAPISSRTERARSNDLVAVDFFFRRRSI
jgi:hypothetical protein